jgi:hypothetical protein
VVRQWQTPGARQVKRPNWAYRAWWSGVWERKRLEYLYLFSKQLRKERDESMLQRQINHGLEQNIQMYEALLQEARARNNDPLAVAQKLNVEAEMIFEGAVRGGLQMYEVRSWLGEYRAHKFCNEGDPR